MLILQIQETLANGEQLQSHTICARAGITQRRFQKNIRKFIDLAHLSRIKVDGHGYYWYYLTDEQLRTYRLRKQLHEKQADIALPVAPAEMHDRMAFLRHLKEKTVFKDYAALGLIIADYERALQAGAKAETEALA